MYVDDGFTYQPDRWCLWRPIKIVYFATALSDSSLFGGMQPLTTIAGATAFWHPLIFWDWLPGAFPFTLDLANLQMLGAILVIQKALKPIPVVNLTYPITSCPSEWISSKVYA